MSTTVKEKFLLDAAYFFTKILDEADDIVSCADMEGRIFYVNKKGMSFFKIEGVVVMNPSIPSFHPQSSLDKIMKEGIPYAFEHGSWEGETEILVPEDVIIKCSQKITLHKDAKGKPEFLSTIIRIKK